MLMFRSFHTCILHIDKKIFNFGLVVPTDVYICCYVHLQRH